MLGPLTLKVAEAVDEYANKLTYKISDKLCAEQQDVEFTIIRIPLFIAAHDIYKGSNAHPKILWGNFWFLYYQAWLWKLSKDWREKVVEVWLNRLYDKGELQRLLTELVESD